MQKVTFVQPHRKDGVRVDPMYDMTIVCAVVGAQDHGMCTGWINPLTARSDSLVSACLCMCHDGYRMPLGDARRVTAERLRDGV